MKPLAILALLTLPISVGCGTSTEKPQTEQIQMRTDQSHNNAKPMVENADVKIVEPVSFTELQTLLPEMPGWRRERPTGERVTTPVNFSDASVRLTNGEAVVMTKITDSALNPVLVAPFARFLTGNYERKLDNGYEKSITIGGAPGLEQWQSGPKSGTLTIVLNQRFIVEVDGSGIDDPKVLYAMLEKTNLKKLAELK